MDGTLLNSKKEISKENMHAIQAARNNGVKVILATGRPKDGVKKYLEELNMLCDDEYVVAYNGGLVQHCLTGEIISKKTLEFSDYETLLEFSDKYNCHIQALTESEIIVPKINRYIERHAELNNMPLLELPISKLSRDIIIVKVMFVDDELILDKVTLNIPKEIMDKFTIVRSGSCYLEFLHKDVNKGMGVSKVAEKLNISRDEVICMGDAENDSHMLQYAGLSIAMANAFDNIKNMADYVTLSNDESGVAHAINKFVLQKTINE